MPLRTHGAPRPPRSHSPSRPGPGPRSTATPPPEPAEADCEMGPDGTVIRVRGELDLDSVHVLHTALHRARGRTVVDLSGVAFADTALLHALLDARAAHGFVLAGPLSTGLRRLFDLSDTRRCFAFTAEG
ncbi:STAS domain-containing protein [Streptomyces sp. NPDC002033]|uniref:STAS domain-containing protein n=1 Tax=unclassified Streptomyces TaxID=2593676 RepID=UPI0033268F43